VLLSAQQELSPLTSASAVAATLNVIGPGLGTVGASESYAIIEPFGRVVLTVCMLLGRLEILTVLALFSPFFWRYRGQLPKIPRR
jgi:trk system potassium uptake protein TrkH